MRRMNNMLLCATAAGSMLFCVGAEGAGVISPLSSAVGRAMPGQIVSVQLFGYYYTAYGRQPWDFKWGGPPYAFPYGDQSHVMYYPGPSYYYPGFQTTYGYNGHMGYPAAVQYANPPGRMQAPPLGD
jgi:hypothetical protein